jgi:hypothetical protein
MITTFSEAALIVADAIGRSAERGEDVTIDAVRHRDAICAALRAACDSWAPSFDGDLYRGEREDEDGDMAEWCVTVLRWEAS